MAYEGKQPCNFSAKASADISGLQFYLVEMSGDNQVNITSTANNKASGVLQNKPESGQHGRICPMGVSKLRVGVACSYGDSVTVADSGWASVVDSGLRAIGFVIDGCNSGGLAVSFINMANAVSELA